MNIIIFQGFILAFNIHPLSRLDEVRQRETHDVFVLFVYISLEKCLPQKWIITVTTFCDKNYAAGLEKLRQSKLNIIGERKHKDSNQLGKIENSRSNDGFSNHSRYELIEKIRAYERRNTELIARIDDLRERTQRNDQIT